jgi:16S rRNA (guanine966-N2)-methyltransferase
MRVIAGTARGRKIEAPPGRGTRPITDRAKEAIFNMLTSLGGLDDVTVVDLFAGSGSFGIECLSRGARHVTFVEQDRRAAAVLVSNLDRLGFSDRATLRTAAVEAAIDALAPADLVFCDPPYAWDRWTEVLPRLPVGPGGLLVAHANRPVELTAPWSVLRERTYGRSCIVIAKRLAQ